MYKNLPEKCWGVLKASNELVMLERGVRGYYAQNPDNVPWGAESVDILNERIGVTKAQRSAMEAGSMWGWDVPAANPAMYDEDGKFKKQ